MTWAAAVAGSIALTAAGVKAAHGAHQKNKARKMKVDRPTMTRSNASIEQENMARNMAMSTRMPGQSIAENNIGAQTARSSSNIAKTGGSTGDIIAGLGAVDQNSRDAQNDLAGQAAAYSQRNKELFSNVLSGASQDQKELFDYNSNQPYQTALLRKQALMGAGERNINNGIDGATDAGMGFASNYGYSKGMGSSSSNQRFDRNGNYIAASTGR